MPIGRNDTPTRRQNPATPFPSFKDSASEAVCPGVTCAANGADWRSPKNDNLWQGVNGVNNPCPGGYRLPTETELNAERLSWSPNNNASGAFASPLKLPRAGRRNINDGSFSSVGSIGYYWSSSVSSTNSPYLRFEGTDAYMENLYRALGHSVRCIKN